jgi:hypothetical protein
VHEVHVAFLLLPLVAGPSSTPSPPSTDIKVALITAVGLVLAAVVTGLIGTIKREATPRSTVESSDALTLEMVREVQEALDTCNADLGAVREKYALLREACWRKRLDPDELIKGVR